MHYCLAVLDNLLQLLPPPQGPLLPLVPAVLHWEPSLRGGAAVDGLGAIRGVIMSVATTHIPRL